MVYNGSIGNGKEVNKLGIPKEEKLIKVSFSQLKSWRRCQKMHHYKYVKNLQKKTQALPLYKGSVVHSCLEYHYLGLDWKKSWKVFKKEFDKLFPEEKAVYGDLPSEIKRLLRGYLKHYKDDNIKVATDKEGKPLVEREFELRIPGTRVVVHGIIDLIVEDVNNLLWVWDHKTVKKDTPSSEFRMTDVQTTLYFWVVLTLCEEWGLDTKRLKGAVFNYIRTEPPKVPVILQNGTASRANIDTCWMYYKEFLIENGLDPKDYLDMKKKLKGNEERFYHRHKMDKPKALMKILLQEAVFTAYQIEAYENMEARSLDKSCDWGCDFKDLCYTELQGLDTDSITQALYERREKGGRKAQKEKEKRGLVYRDEI